MIHENRPETPEAYLEHYGKKGMKWGQRRAHKFGATNGQIASARKRSKGLRKQVRGARKSVRHERTLKGQDAAYTVLRQAKRKKRINANVSYQQTTGQRNATRAVGVLAVAAILASSRA